MNPAVASALVLAAASLLVGLLTARNNRVGQSATTAIESRKVDLDEFREYRETVSERLGWAEKRIGELEDMVKDERERREEAEQRAGRAERRAEQAEARAARLERRVGQLEQVLRDHDMPVPPTAEGPEDAPARA